MSPQPLPIVLLSLCVLLHTSQALFVEPQSIPVARLIKKLEANRDADPKKAEGHYLLARLHYLAFATEATELESYSITDLDFSLPEVFVRGADGKVKWEGPREKRSTPARKYHAEHAVRGFEEAIQLDPQNPFYWLGYASVMEDIWSWVFAKDPKLFPDQFSKIKVPSLRDAYGRALVLGKKADATVKIRYAGAQDEFVSYEAATALVRLEAASTAPFSDDQKRELQEARETIARFQKMPVVRGPITPIVFSLRRNVAELSDLLTPNVSVDFDLRGYGWKERWPWVKPELGFLVWDPEETGLITSARQLFGSYTFRLFWKNGYHALEVLDDNGDGRLEGPELAGIRAWFDRNSDGKSDSAEVTSLAELGVISVATRASGKDGIHPVADRGIITRNGDALRTWDWMVEPLPRALPSE